ncbi:MAG: FAD-dependent oxidoreductase, partial [Pseudomonadota bacterium]
MVNTYIEQEYAVDASDLSATHYDEGYAYGGPDVIFPQGYGQLAEFLADGLDVRLNERVTQIVQIDDGVQISTSSGMIDAARVIVSVPIGVLKHGDISFDPPLPAAKQAAIDAIGSAVMNKVYLRFEEPFW